MDAGLDDNVRGRLSPLKGAVVRWVNDDWPDLTNRQLALLLIVCIEPGNHYLRHLATRLGVQKPIACRILDRLNDLGLITRQHERRDLRNVYAVPTARAIAFMHAFDAFFSTASH